MKVTADTNVLLRVMLQDDPGQSEVAQAALREATLVAVTLPTLCEFAWVLSQGYKQAPSQIALAIEALLTIKTVRTDHAAVEAGLAMLGLGGDFADGVIDYEGRRLGGETYMTFDKKASKLVSASGRKVRLLVGAR